MARWLGSAVATQPTQDRLPRERFMGCLTWGTVLRNSSAPFNKSFPSASQVFLVVVQCGPTVARVLALVAVIKGSLLTSISCLS